MLNHFDRKANPSRIHITFPMVDIGHYTAAWPFITEVTFENVHHVQIFSFVIEVCLWYIGFVLEFILSFHHLD